MVDAGEERELIVALIGDRQVLLAVRERRVFGGQK